MGFVRSEEGKRGVTCVFSYESSTYLNCEACGDKNNAFR